MVKALFKSLCGTFKQSQQEWNISHLKGCFENLYIHPLMLLG